MTSMFCIGAYCLCSFNLVLLGHLIFYTIKSLEIQSSSRLFGFIGAGATLGQLFGSLFTTAMTCLGLSMSHHSYLFSFHCFLSNFLSLNFFLDLLLFAALLLELAVQSSKGIDKYISQSSEELVPIRYFVFIFMFN